MALQRVWDNMSEFVRRTPTHDWEFFFGDCNDVHEFRCKQCGKIVRSDLYILESEWLTEICPKGEEIPT